MIAILATVGLMLLCVSVGIATGIDNARKGLRPTLAGDERIDRSRKGRRRA